MPVPPPLPTAARRDDANHQLMTRVTRPEGARPEAALPGEHAVPVPLAIARDLHRVADLGPGEGLERRGAGGRHGRLLLHGSRSIPCSSTAKYWVSGLPCLAVERCLQRSRGDGYMKKDPIAHLFADTRVLRIFAGANEALKELVARSL